MKRVRLKRILCLAAILLLGADSVPVANSAQSLGDSTLDGTRKDSIVLNSFNQNSYINYLTKYNDAPSPLNKFLIKNRTLYHRVPICSVIFG